MNNPTKAQAGGGGSMTPTIIIQYTCQESLERLPDLYLHTMREAVAICADNLIRLHEIKVELLNIKAQIEEYEANNWIKNSGFRGSRYE